MSEIDKSPDLSEGFIDLRNKINRFTKAPPDIPSYTPMFLICDDPAIARNAIDVLRAELLGSKIEVIDAANIPEGASQHLFYSLICYFPKGQPAILEYLNCLPKEFILKHQLEKYLKPPKRESPPAVIVVLNADTLSIKPDGSPANRARLDSLVELGLARDALNEKGLLPAAVIFQISPEGLNGFTNSMGDTARWMSHIVL